MEKYQLLLPEDDEHCVSELGHLGEGEEPRPEAAHFVWFHKVGVADGVVEASGGQGVQELREDSSESKDTEDGQKGTPGGEGPPQLVSGSRSHPSLSGEDKDDVDGASPGRHRHPVLLHPPLRLPLVEALLKVEDMRVDRLVAGQRLRSLQAPKLRSHPWLLQQLHLHSDIRWGKYILGNMINQENT